jgi:EamA domain-containing membrane protein RarD
LHHLLLRNGLTVTQSLLVLYAICVALAGVGFQTRAIGSNLRFGIFALLVAAGYAALRVLERRAARLEADAARAAEANAAELARAEHRAAG